LIFVELIRDEQMKTKMERKRSR